MPNCVESMLMSIPMAALESSHRVQRKVDKVLTKKITLKRIELILLHVLSVTGSRLRLD